VNAADYSGADYLRFICGTCRDLRVLAAPEGTPGTVQCPACGTDEQRRELFIKNKTMPEICVSDLTPEEQDLFRGWRIRGHHELDCLRWIEGRRYNPKEDAEFMADVKVRLDEWRRARDEQDAEYRKNHPYSPDDPRGKPGYSPEDDLISDRDARRAAWRKILGEPELAPSRIPPLHPCVECGAACDEQTLFCPPCWAKHQRRARM
jgi:hypothetical protein